jgi:transcriptional regulator PpsR
VVVLVSAKGRLQANKSSPKETDNVIEELSHSALVNLLHQMTDISLVVDAKGRIVECRVLNSEFESDFEDDWVGMNWVDTVTEESRPRIENFLQQPPDSNQPGSWVDVVHSQADGGELPISYCTSVSQQGENRVCFGRDMRAMASLRQQLVNAQITLERDYWRLRQVETRYRLVFQMVDEAVLVIDEVSGKILEANNHASHLLGARDKQGSLVGKSFLSMFEGAGAIAVKALLSEIHVVGRSEKKSISALNSDHEFSISAHLLKQDSESRILLRLKSDRDDVGTGSSYREDFSELSAIVQDAPDAILITDSIGKVLKSNQRFVDLAELINQEQAQGYSIDRWFGRSAVDLNVLLGHLRRGEPVRLFATTLRGEYGTPTEVEISASVFTLRDDACFMFVVRDVARRLSTEDPAASQLPRSVAQITQQVGRLPLKALVRQSTDVVEKLCIEAALELTGDNRASAAELLGLSRQSLYSKLRLHNLGESGSGDDG